MDNSLPGDSSHGANAHKYSVRNVEDGGQIWYFSRKEIEDNSPSRRDSIDLKREVYLRKSYCIYLQDLGMRLLLPQQTIATAITFCHRFFLRQSHAKNDRRTIATACMFLAGKVEETPRPLKDVILISYEIIHKKDPEVVQNIKQKLVYEQQKEVILNGERVVLATLGFDLNVKHPYKPLMDAINKFVVDQKALRTIAWNFVNDGLRTSLCLQFKPHHIAAGAIFLAAKFLKVKLPSDGEKVWWHEFDVRPRQLEEVSNQMLELYEQNQLPPSANNETKLVTWQVTPKDSCDNEGHFGRNLGNREGTLGQFPQGTFTKIDKDKVKAALEKQNKSRGDVTWKSDFLDEADLIKRELEAGIELAAESGKNSRQEHEKHQVDAGDHLDDIDNSFHSPKPSNRKRKVWSYPDKTSEDTVGNDYAPSAHH